MWQSLAMAMRAFLMRHLVAFYNGWFGGPH
jgi:hypothetical protein